MIDDPFPKNWKDLQEGVCRLLNEVGLTAKTEIEIETPRGKVVVDVHAVDQKSIDKIQYIIECKNWGKRVHKSVVHAFTTVMHETGGHIGYIISQKGGQSGAVDYTQMTNISVMTYLELQMKYLTPWFENYYAPNVAKAAEYPNYYTEDFNYKRDEEFAKLSEGKKAVFQNLADKYYYFIFCNWLADMSQYLRRTRDFTPPSLESIKSGFADPKVGGIIIQAKTYRELMFEVCDKLKQIEDQFNEIFGRNIFLDKSNS